MPPSVPAWSWPRRKRKVRLFRRGDGRRATTSSSADTIRPNGGNWRRPLPWRMRNAYLLAVAPTSSTGIIAGTTASIDPVMKRFFLEEKKGAMLPRVAPGLSDKTYWLYKDISAGTIVERACCGHPPTAYRPGAKHEPLHHQRIHHAPTFESLSAGLGVRVKTVLRPQQVLGSRRM